MDGRLILRVTGSLHIPTDFAIHHERTMRSLSHVGLHSMDENAASNLSGTSDRGDREAHHQSLEPANIVSEDITLASTRCVVVDDDVGFCGDGRKCSDAANCIHEEYLGDLITMADVSIRRCVGKAVEGFVVVEHVRRKHFELTDHPCRRPLSLSRRQTAFPKHPSL